MLRILHPGKLKTFVAHSLQPLCHPLREGHHSVVAPCIGAAHQNFHKVVKVHKVPRRVSNKVSHCHETTRGVSEREVLQIDKVKARHESQEIDYADVLN